MSAEMKDNSQGGENPGSQPPRPEETLRQPGIIFRALGSTLSSEELLRRLNGESGDK